ncbi:MAG TPA: NAD(P)-dependent oxidoreductase [Terriglobales bacterium]|nr:NAD(P)-dependent oxidoreductase [Terriglobales bacterium]
MDAGLIGLGNMGTGIARSLLRGGHHLTVYNRTAQKAEALRSSGARVAASVSEACRQDIVFTMVADDAALQSVVCGEQGVLASLGKGSIHVSLSTISVALADRLGEDHEQRGQGFVSAPVFGRPEAAEAGRLAVVAAGREEYVSRCKPLFSAMGPKLLVVGAQPSLANTVKLAGNFLIANVLESLAEAIAFARKSGVDARALMDFLTTTLFDAPVYKIYGNLIVEGKHNQVGFALPLGLKDVRLVLEAAGAKNVPMPVASLVHDRLLTALARGHANQDWSVLGRIAAEDAGLQPAG